MSRTHDFDALETIPDQGTSRRDMLKRLAALGLAAGGVGLASLTAAAAGKPGGKQRRGDGRGRDRGPSPQLDLPEDLPDPRIAPLPGIQLLTIGALSQLGTRRVYVYGTVFFDGELLALMRLGRQFRLTCQLNADEDNPPIRLDIPGRPGIANVWGGPGATGSAPFRFQVDVARTKLDEDAPSRFIDPFGTDEIHAKLYLDTRRTDRHFWRRATLANGLTYYTTNQVAQVL